MHRSEADPEEPRVSPLGVAAVLFIVAMGHLILFPRIADLDGFYHIGHAFAYAAGSIFDTSMPWATQSVIGDLGADLWWGFHVLLLPFTSLPNVETAIRLAAVALTLLLSGAFLVALRRHGVRAAPWWTALFLLAVPNVFYRYLMVRPHVVSLGASLLLLSFLVRGRWWQATLLAALITWTHLSLFWIGIGLAAAYTLVVVIDGLANPVGLRHAGVSAQAAVPAVALGTLVGWILRPHPLDTAVLANVQVIRLFAQKATEEPLLFAAELAPLTPMELIWTSWFFLPLWVAAVALVLHYVFRRPRDTAPPEIRTLLITSVLVSSVFLCLTLLSARRAMVQWVAFGSLMFPFTWHYLVPHKLRLGARSMLAVALTAHLAWAAGRHVLNANVVAFPADTMADVADFLEEHSEPGEIVFHARWDNFGPLFARNRHDLYLGGMDPIFQFSHDPRLYWEYFYLSADINLEWTCDAFPCAAGTATDTHAVLGEHFGARWVVVEPRRNPRLSLYFLNDPRYELALETQHEAVFEILADYPTGRGPADETPRDIEPRSGS